MTKAFLNGAAALLLFLSGCAPASLPPAQSQHAASDLIQEQSVPYQFGVGYSGSGYTQSFEEWRDLVLEDTHGNVELVLYGENVLGEGENMVKAAQRGTLSIAASSTSVCTSIIPEAAILDIPACFTAYIQPFRVYDRKFFDALNHAYREQGLELLYLRTGEPWIISSTAPITSLEQLRGLRLRTSGSFYHNQLYDALGVQRIENVGLSGLEYILEENGIDAIETTYTILRSQNLLQLQPYALRGPLFVMSSAIVMNYDAFHTLPSDYQEVLKSRLSQILNQRQAEVSTQQTSELQIHDLTPKDQETLQQLAEPLLEEILGSVDQSLVQALLLENGVSSQ